MAVTQGIRSAAVTGVDGGSRNASRTKAFPSYKLLETENGYVLGGTNRGKKAVADASTTPATNQFTVQPRLFKF